MTERLIEEIMACMAVDARTADIQRIQTAHRLRLSKFWGIREGERILEIGCGQGDTTAVLAHLTGPGGFVHGIDIGPDSYGAPFTLGEAAEILKASPLGGRIRMDFDVDVLDPEISFGNMEFDRVVLSHCSWYMASREELIQVLAKVRHWSRKLSFAEWDSRITDISQYPHLLAALIQAQLEAFKKDSDSNIRTLLTADDLRDAASSAGWHVTDEYVLKAVDIQDGLWETQFILHNLEMELEDLTHLPPKVGPLLRSERSLLEDAVERHGISPLDVFVFTAE